MDYKIHLILGPTASGKTAHSIDLAKRINGEIVNFDSMQVYREIPILSAQPTNLEYSSVPHHLFGMIKCGDKFDVKKWLDLAVPRINEIFSRGKSVVMVGGTGMYINALIEGIAEIPDIPTEIRATLRELEMEEVYHKLATLDPDMAAKLKQKDRQRVMRALEVILTTGKSLSFWQKQKVEVPFAKSLFEVVYIDRDRSELYERINTRFDSMLELGAIAEAENLLEAISPLPKACGLFELLDYLRGNISKQEAVDRAKQSTRNYAKRQITWFKNKTLPLFANNNI